MRRLWIIAILACGPLVFTGCGGDKKETADNSSNSSDTSDSSSRPKRNSGGNGGGGGNTKQSGGGNAGGGAAGGGQMSGDPRMNGGGRGDPGDQQGGEMSGDPRMNGGGGGDSGDQQGGEMMGDPRMSGGKSGGREIPKPPGMSQEAWDAMSPEAKSRFGDLASGGGGSSAGGDQQGQMSGDPRANGGRSGGGDEQGGQMSGDPRSGGGGAGSSSPPGDFGGGGGAGSSSPPGDFGSGQGGSGFGGGRQANTTPKTLKEKAIRAFQTGDDDGGYQFMYGHMIAEDEGRKSIPLQFMSSIRRPRSSIRWGIGVVVKQNKGFEGAPPKIGEKPNVLPQPRGSRNRGNGGGFGGNRFGGDGEPGTAGSGSGAGGAGAGSFGGGFGNRNGGSPSNGGMEELKYYTGEVGEVLVEMLDKLRSRGQFGKMIAKVEAGSGGQSRNNGGFNSGSPIGGSGGGAGIDDGRTAEDFNRRGGGGNFNNNRNNNQKNSADAASSYKNVIPGVLMLGKSSLKSLAARAKSHGIEILVVFDVNLKFVPSNGQKINETKVSLYDVTGPTPVRVGKPSSMLTNIRVWMTREKNPGNEDNDPIRVAVKKIFEVGKEDGFLTKYKLSEMPNLNQEQAMNRLKSLISEGQASGNPMPALVELTYYREKGLVPEKAYVDSVNQLAGAEIGDTMLNGSEEDRVKAINSLLPPEWKVIEGAGGESSDDVL